MSRSEIIRELKKFKEENAEEYGILALGIFGSVAKDEAKKNSDVDVVVKIKKQDLFKLIGIKQDLEEIFNVPVDVISYREKMNSFLKKRIEKEAIYV
ncbi:MAG: nucleotidyltransferase domain-containing protein [Candidatus Marinimicrobia bacterium]|nr:nucleotidyltransferase domain-containing protein [Candidatus Neomarinimicrobiota bacterium]